MNNRRYSKPLAGLITTLILLFLFIRPTLTAAGDTRRFSVTPAGTEENRESRQQFTSNTLGYIPMMHTENIGQSGEGIGFQVHNVMRTNVWTPLGLKTQTWSLAIDPVNTNTIYAGTINGVYKSTNGGGNWSATGLTNSWVIKLAIDPVTPSTLYAGTNTYPCCITGVYKSTDSGESWSETGLKIGVNTLAIDPTTPSTLYAGWGSVYGGLYKSTNGGESWSAIYGGMGVDAVVIDPQNTSTLYVGERGVYKSIDGGENWSEIITGLTQHYVHALAIDPATPSTLYAGTGSDPFGSVFKSTNGGENWSEINNGLIDNYVLALAIDPATPSTLYVGKMDAGVYKSTNGGEDWSAINTGLTNTYVSALAIDPASPTTLYAGGGGGVFKIDFRTYSISGRVTDSSSNPISGVSVMDGSGDTTTTDSNGNYMLSGLAAGTYLIYASKADYLFNPYPLTVVLDSDRPGQNILGSLSSCILPSGINSVDALANMCRIPTTQPFLDLPFTYSDFVISANAREGSLPGLVTAWMDHDLQVGKVRTWGTNQSTSVGSMCNPSDPISLCYDQHEGTDFALSVGTPVKPAAPGVVVEVCKDPPCGRGRGYGRYVLIDHENGYATLYAHLQTIDVAVGDRFYPNTSFAPLGTSGRSGGDANIPFSETYWKPHLHFGLYFDLDNSGTWTTGEEVDPYGWNPPNGTADPMGRPNIYMWKYPLNVSYCYTPSTETQTAQFDNLTASFPPGSLTSDTTVTLGIGSLPGSLLEALRNASQSFFLSLIQWLQTGSGQLGIRQASADLSTPASITVEYDPSAILHLVESQLTINRWDDLSNSWIALPTTINTIAHTATAQTDSAGSFILQAPLICPADTLEPNDNYDGASLIQTDGTLTSNLFDIATDEDWFKFDAVTGVEYNIQTTNLTTGVDTVLEIYDTDGVTLLASDDNSGGGNASSLTWQAPQEGLYFLRVSRATGSAFGCNAVYQLGVVQWQRLFLPLIVR